MGTDPAAFKVVSWLKCVLFSSFNVYKRSIFWSWWSEIRECSLSCLYFLISVVHLYQNLFPREGNWRYFKLFFCAHIFYLRWSFTRCRGQDPNHCCLQACAVVPATLLENFTSYVSPLWWNFRFVKISAPYAHEANSYLFPTLGKWSNWDSVWALCYPLNVLLRQWRGRQGRRNTQF